MSGRLELATRHGQPVLPLTPATWFETTCGGPGPKLVWLCMCYLGRPRPGSAGGGCWAAVATIARLAECHVGTVRRHLRTLQVGGRIEAEAVSSGRRPTHYRLVGRAGQPEQNARVEPEQNARVRTYVRPIGRKPRAPEREGLPVDSWRAVYPATDDPREVADPDGPAYSPAREEPAPGPERCAPDKARAMLETLRLKLEARGLHPGRRPRGMSSVQRARRTEE